MNNIPHLLLTGGAGYIGTICAHQLLSQGYNVTIFDNLSGGAKPPKFGQFVFGDVRDKLALDDLFGSNRFNAVLHFAGKIQVGESVDKPLPYFDTNVVGTLRILEAIVKYNVPKLVFSSTAAVYGTPQYIPLNESHPIAPLSPYGQTKATAETIIESACKAHNLQAVILRYFNAAGALIEAGLGESHVPETHLIPLLIAAAHNKDMNFKVFGDSYDTPDGSCIRDYIHVTDLANAHICALKYMNTPSRRCNFFNIGTGLGHSVFEVIAILEGIMECSLGYTIASPRKGDAAVLVTDPKKAITELSWSPSKTIEDILRDAVAYSALG